MQLLLASNRIFGRQHYGVHWPPRLRTHGVGETIQFLVDAGLAADGGGAAAVDWLPAHQAPWYVDTLLPTIDYALIREGTRDLELIGQFGAPRGSDDIAGGAEVRYGTGNSAAFRNPAVARSVARALELVRDAADPPLSRPGVAERSWKGDVITLNAQPLGTRGGYVQVRNGGRCVQCGADHLLEDSGSRGPRCRQRAAHRVHDRAAPARRRQRAPHASTSNAREAKRIIALASMFESAAHYAASGEAERDGQRRDHHPHLERRLQQRATTVPGEHPVGCSGLLQWDQRRVSIVITGGTGTCMQREVKRRGEETLSDITGPLL